MTFLVTSFFVGWQLLKKNNILAAEEYNSIKIYNAQNFELEQQIPLYENSTGYSLSTLDLGGDGQSEILIAAGPGEKPWIKILTGKGWIINEFLAYAENFTGGVNVVGCDLDGDGKSEIVTGVRSNGGAHVRVFDGYGKTKINDGFFADENLNTGVQVGCADVDGDNSDEIITVSGPIEKKYLKIFKANGELLKSRPLELDSKNIKISRVDLGGDGRDEILIAAGWNNQPWVKIFRSDLSLINEFLTYDQNFSGGLNIIGIDIDNDNKDEIITLPGLMGGPHFRIFDGYGKEKITSKNYLFDKNFIGGSSLSIADVDGDGQEEIIVAPENLAVGDSDIYKYIDIDVTQQRFRYYQHGFLLGDFPTSTGKPSTATRLGEFKADSKYEMAYGGADGQRWGMPYFIGFYMSGNLENGIHELPFLNGYREGASSLGHAVSHGCVRLDIGPAKEVYDWTEVDQTKIFVHR